MGWDGMVGGLVFGIWHLVCTERNEGFDTFDCLLVRASLCISRLLTQSNTPERHTSR